jgi:hypothetical protein
MKLTIIPVDRSITINQETIFNIEQNLDWIPENIHAVQWYDTYGEIEYKTNVPNEKIFELGIFEQAIIDYNNEKNRIEEEKIQKELEIESSRDYWKELRDIRNYKLQECDWTQILDTPLSEEQKINWKNYRQELRNLPENIQDPKPLVLDLSHLSWPINPA